MERKQSQQERRIPSASSKPEMPNDRRTARSGEKSAWQSRTNNKRGDGRTSGGSRYAERKESLHQVPGTTSMRFLRASFEKPGAQLFLFFVGFSF